MSNRNAQAPRAGQAEFVRWFGPLLNALRDLGGSASPREAVDRIAETERVPTELLNAALKSGQSRFYNQVHWARQYLVWGGLIDSGKRGVWSLTPLGRDTRLDAAASRQLFLQQVKRHADLRKRADGGAPPAATPDDTLQSGQDATLEIFLRVVRGLSPKEVRDLRGAMDGRAEKGIFLMTSAFSTNARAEAERPGAAPIELVDGVKLFEMFKKHELGLKPRMVYDVDPSFFEPFG